MSSLLETAYIGRPKGRKNARSHFYLQKHGYSIRLCDWVGENEPVKVEGPVTCQHCLKIQRGERGTAFEP